MKEPKKEDDVKKKEEKPEKKVWQIMDCILKLVTNSLFILEELQRLQTPSNRSLFLGVLA